MSTDLINESLYKDGLPDAFLLPSTGQNEQYFLCISVKRLEAVRESSVFHYRLLGQTVNPNWGVIRDSTPVGYKASHVEAPEMVEALSMAEKILAENQLDQSKEKIWQILILNK